MRPAGAVLLWAAFLSAHLVVAVLGWVLPGQPMGDVVLVYDPWSHAALSGGEIVGVTTTWVYPQVALIPMLLAQVMSWPMLPLVGSGAAYLIAWVVLVTALDALAFAILLGRGGSSTRRRAAWFWVLALALLGPIALYRIDAVVVPVAVIGALWLGRRPLLATVLLTVGAWIKIWPAALVLAAVVTVRHRARVILAAAATSLGVLLVLLALGGSEHLFGFVVGQRDRGLQVEAVAATPLVWAVRAGAAEIRYSFDILTFQVEAPLADVICALLLPVMAVGVLAVGVVGGVAAARGASARRLFPPLALSLVTMLIVTNSVGSPQFTTWLIAPVVVWITRDRSGSAVAAAVVLVLCALTFVVYPLTYDALLRAELLPVVLLSARNALLVILLALSLRAVARCAVSSPRQSAPQKRGTPMLIAFSVAPGGTGTADVSGTSDGSVHDAVAAAVRVVRESGLPHRTSSMFTEIEGPDWDTVMDVVKRATEAVMPFGSRVSLVLKADIRPGYTGELDAKLDRLEAALAEGADG